MKDIKKLNSFLTARKKIKAEKNPDKRFENKKNCLESLKNNPPR